MSEYYDNYHRWEPLAEFKFVSNRENEDEFTEDNYFYCLCSRTFIRDAVKTYYAEKADGSESEVEVLRESQSQEWEDQSHVHFSLDTSYKVKCEKDEGASCYCSASHTDNYCSTDEHDPAQAQGTISHALQPSDSGADLTYQDCHSDYTNTHQKLEKMDQDLSPIQLLTDSEENYFSEVTWEKFWAINGERIIWASWIKKYSDYINPSYLNENNDLVLDENSLPKQHSIDQIYGNEQADANQQLIEDDQNIRERKFSYDSKVNPYKKGHKTSNEKSGDFNKDDTWLPLARKRSCSEHDRILSPRTVAGTDSMTNVTKITLSSFDVTSSHVTSESSPTNDYSMSSSTSDEQNDQTRIANLDESAEPPSEELDTEQYWQFLWKKHFGEQYSLHYANYIQSHDEKVEEERKDLPAINIVNSLEPNAKSIEKVLEIECETSEGNSQELPSVIEVLARVDNIKLDEKVTKPRKRNKKSSAKVINSVGMLLQNLLKEEQIKNEPNDKDTVVEAGEDKTDKTEPEMPNVVETSKPVTNTQSPASNIGLRSYSYDDGDEDPPEEKPVSLKRSHEVDEEEVKSEKVRSTLEIMGFNVDPDNLPKGNLVYRKRPARLRPPRYKRSWLSKKTYFDDDGNAYQAQESNDEREMQTDDDDCADVKSDNEKIPRKTDSGENENVLEQSKSQDADSEESKETKPEDTRLPSDMNSSFNSVEQDDEEPKLEVAPVSEVNAVDSTKRRRRGKRHTRSGGAEQDSEIPLELRDDYKMKKYWKKRHSLFHRFDEGIKLDRESWFSVTPESVARHIADKFSFDVVLDAFAGAGGNTIQFAKTCAKVIAIDIDPAKIEMARHNATVYGVAERVEFIVGDFFELAPTLQADMVFLSPPWGGPKYSENYEYNIETMLEPKPASELMAVARTISPNIALYLPRNTKSDQILSLAKDTGGSLEVEQSYLDKRFVAITAYFY